MFPAEKEPPTLAELHRDFPLKRTDLETILRMSDEDASFARIAPEFAYRPFKTPSEPFPEYSYGDPKSPLPRPRWDAYRSIYGRDGIKLGIQRDSAKDAFVMVDSVGLLNRGHTTGYVHCETPPSRDQDRFFPCIVGGDSASQGYSSNPRKEAYSFQKLDDRWYAYDDGPS